MTKAYLGHWLDAANHYRMQLLGDAADNPDQRIAEDIQMFVDRTLTIGIGLLSALVTLGSFVVILWTLSVAAPLHLFGSEWNIPGYLVWAALIYAVVGTYFTHLIGWPLVTLNFNQQRYEADFRFNLVRVRENSEQIALLKGEPAETERLIDRFGRVVANWLLIMTRTKQLTFFTAAYSQVSIVFPVCRGQPRLLRRQDAARRADADRLRLQQRANLAVVLHQCLSLAGGVAGGHPAPGWVWLGRHRRRERRRLRRQ